MIKKLLTAWVFGMLDARAVEPSFRKWVSGLIPALEPDTVVAVKDNQPNLAESIREFKSRKDGIKTRRMVASTSDAYRAQLPGLLPI